jgi:hypothetical protein
MEHIRSLLPLRIKKAEHAFSILRQLGRLESKTRRFPTPPLSGIGFIGTIPILIKN